MKNGQHRLKSVTNISKLSPTSATNIDVANIFLRSIIYWKHYILAVFRRFRPGYQYFGMFLSQNRGVTHCSSTVQLRSANQRKNQLTFEAFELIPISYIVQRDSFLTRLDIEMPQQNLYAASGILKYG